MSQHKNSEPAFDEGVTPGPVSIVSGRDPLAPVDVMTVAVEMLDAVAKAHGRDTARQAARTIASDLSASDLRELAVALSMTGVSLARKSQGRARLIVSLRDLRFKVQMNGLEGRGTR